MISVQNVSAGYGGKDVLHGISLEIRAGEFVGFIGPNGSGKTTLLRVMSGVLRPSAGRVIISGSDLRSLKRKELARTIAFLAQDIAPDLAFTVREVVLMGRSPHLSPLAAERPLDLQVAEEAMSLVDVAHLADRPVTDISGGERQRAFIAMCLAQEPRALLLDEPTSHLDVGHQLSILNLILRLNRDRNLTVVAVFHDLNLASEYCQRLLLLREGRTVALGRPEEVVTQEAILDAYRAKVLVQRNPISGKPHVVLAAGEDWTDIATTPRGG